VAAGRPIASAFVRIRPTFAGFAPALAKGISGDAKQGGTAFGRMFGRQATTEAGRHGRVFGSVFARASAGSIRSSAGLVTGSVRALVAGFAVVKGLQVFSGFIAEGREAQKVGALTAAVLKSTGGAAKISAKGVGDLATAISNKVGVDDEAVQSGQNLLLTFTGIRDEAGRGNKIFSRASQAIVDMTAAMNKGVVSSEGLKASSIQVGKALNDPVRGMTALRKVGVAFTEQQEKQIKTMVASGDRLGAQKVILAELNREFGGAAAASTTAGQKLGVVFGNIKERIGAALIPVLDRVENFFAARLPGAIEVGSRFFAKVSLGVSAMSAAFREGDVTSDGFVEVMERIGVQARAAFDVFKSDVLPRLKDLGKFLVGTVIPAVARFTGWLIRNRDVLIPLAAGIGAIVAAVKVWMAVTKAFLVVQAALNVVLALNPVGIVVLALVGLAAALFTAYKRSETFRRIVDGAFRGIAAAARFMWYQVVSPALRLMLNAFLTVPGVIINAAAKAFGWVPGIGPKLKAAAEEFNKFRDKANAALGGLDDQKVTVSLGWRGLKTFRTQGGNLAFRRGGRIDAGTTPTADDVPIWASKGETVVSAADSAQPEFRAWAKQRGIPGFARGGRVGFGVDVSLPNFAALRRSIASFNRALGTAADFVARTLGNQALGGAGAIRGLAFARAQAGKPYGWGAVGPGSYDCSGLWSAVVNVIRGRDPYRRLFSTASFAGGSPAGFVRGLASAVRVGVMQGNPGHMAGTIGRVNVEARGDDGVVVGPRARGASNALFGSRFGLRLARGGLVGDPPFDLLDRRGRDYRPGLLDWLLGDPLVADRGVLLPPGPSLVDNRTGRPEPLRPADDPLLLHPKTVRALADAIGEVVLRGVAVAGQQARKGARV